MDTKTALIDYFYNLLVHDAILIDLMVDEENQPTVGIHRIWAVPDAIMPYLVHRLNVRAANDEGDTVELGDYYLDIWDYSDTVERVEKIRQRIIALLESFDGITFDLPGREALAVRIHKEVDNDVPEDTEGIWHIETQWSLRYIRRADTQNIILERSK